MAAFHALAQRSVPLVDAIKAYQERYGHPPKGLNALVPDFLPAVPKTGIGAYPYYEYLVPKKGSFEGNPWTLSVFTPSGGVSFDQFLYFPLQNYPPTGYGGWLERVDDWAYVHE